MCTLPFGEGWISTHIHLPALSPLSISRFSNDNLFVKIEENVRELDVFVVQSFSEPVSEHILELLIILDALRTAGARRITAVIPNHATSWMRGQEMTFR